MSQCVSALSILALVVCAAVAAGQSSASPVVFQPGPEVQKRYMSPSPGQDATNQSKRAVIGQGKTAIDTGDPKNLSWSEPIDLMGAGTIVNADMLWDGSSKIFYVFANTGLRCTHGKSTEAGILLGIYGRRNFLSKTPGSGWWVVDLAKDQCQAPVAGLYGCKFDSYGNILACGRAELDPRINDISIVESTQF